MWASLSICWYGLMWAPLSICWDRRLITVSVKGIATPASTNAFLHGHLVRLGLFLRNTRQHPPSSLNVPSLSSHRPPSLSFHRPSPSTVSFLPLYLFFHRPWSLYFPLPTSLVYFSRTLDMPLCPWCTDLSRPPHYLNRSSIVRHKLAWEYRHGWRGMDYNTSLDTAVAIPEGPDADIQTPITTAMDIDAGEDEGLPRVGKFMY